MKTRFVFPGLIALLMAIPAYGAKILPAYEIQQLPENEEETALWNGARAHENRLREDGGVVESEQLEQYFRDLAARMLGDSIEHLGIELEFILTADPVLSAFAYPHGTIGLRTGLLVRMDNEAQFAAILAHELSHFLQRHTYREMLDARKQAKVGKGLGFLASLVVAKETGTWDQGVMDVAGDFWKNLATSGYSKDNEYESDEEGLELMLRAGLSQDEAIPAFEALGENHVYGAADPRKMWSSHPRLEDRIRNLEKEVKRAKRKKGYEPGVVPDPLDYYRNIAPALLLNAKLDIKERQFRRARESLDRYLQVRPDHAEAHFLVGETYRAANPMGPDFADSQAAYRAALEHDPAYARAYMELGMTHRIQGQNEVAREAFEQYLAHAADAPDAGIVRGYLEGLGQ